MCGNREKVGKVFASAWHGSSEQVMSACGSSQPPRAKTPVALDFGKTSQAFQSTKVMQQQQSSSNKTKNQSRLIRNSRQSPKSSARR